MAAPDASELSRLAREKFRSLGVVVPMDFVPPSTDEARAQYRASGGEERGDPMPDDALFRPATPSRRHREVALENSRIFGEFIDGISAAVAQAWRDWQTAATMSGVSIDGKTASGGSVEGPAWKPVIMAQGPAESKLLRLYSRVVATVVSDAFRQFQSSLTVPGLEWYPDFAEVKSASAPPTPNVPAALNTLSHSGAAMSERALASAMEAALGDEGAPHQAALFASVAHAVAQSFEQWCSSTQVCDVMGSGPVPTFAPPAVPQGAVKGGSASMSPGGFR